MDSHRRPPAVPAQLPTQIDTFTGRETDSNRLLDLLTRQRRGAPVCTISGPAGIGKSTLAIQVAHRAAHAFPDGRLYIDLHGSTPGLEPLAPIEVLRRLLRTLGRADVEVPVDTVDATDMLGSLLGQRRMLIVLDNAFDSTQVHPLLPVGTGSAVLITSRRDLEVRDCMHHTLLDGLDPQDSRALLGFLVGQARMRADPRAAEQIARLCGDLPLALRIAGARLAARPDWTLQDFAEHLQSAHSRLDELQTGDWRSGPASTSASATSAAARTTPETRGCSSWYRSWTARDHYCRGSGRLR